MADLRVPGGGAELCGLGVVKDPDAEGGTYNNPGTGKETGPADRSSPSSRLNFRLLAKETAKLDKSDFFLEEGVVVSKLTPEMLMKEAQ